MTLHNFCRTCSSLVQNLSDNALANLAAQPSPDAAGFGGYEPSQIKIYFDQDYPTRLNYSDDKTVGACSFCSFLLQNVVQVKDGQVASEEVVVKIFRDAERGTFCLDFDFITHDRNPVDTYQIYQCVLHHSSATRVSLDSSNLHLYTRGDNPWVIRDLRRELQATNHELNHKKFVPNRLLNIRDFKSSGSLHLSLRDGVLAELADKGGWPYYATLSYSWGNSPESASAQLKTTREMFDEYMNNIPFEQLPGTVKDAITVCCHLDIPYLWVDALCIIQDDCKDWEQEGSQMALIYKFSFATICAANTTSCHQSFLDRSRLAALESSAPTLLNIPLIPSTDPSQVQGYLSISKDDENAKTLEMQYRDDINNSYWASRGWVFQEQCLSKRLIIFGAPNVYFKSPSRAVKIEGINQRVQQDIKLAFTKIADTKNLAKAATQWYGIAQRYQNKGLTVASDRLPALSGLANEFAYIMGFAASDFVAGNWRQTFITDISWEQEQPQHNLSALIKQLEASALASQLRFPVSTDESNIVRTDDTKTGIIPSWSWMRDANQGGDCWWMPNVETYEPCQEGAREWDVRTATPGSNPFGAITGGYIVLHGKLVSLSSCFEDDIYIKSQERHLLNLQYRRRSLAFISVKFDGLIGDYDIGSLCILPLLQSPVALDLSKDLELASLECDSNNLRGLVLHRAAENGLYVRVGVFHSTSRCSLKKRCRDTNLETIELR
ncbi:hypothetical protein CFIMG_002716RAa3 [Ceratocystis fimbriata CBS 114723]|uniref:Heterokaryon incompatibility domain-containing protein n=1 Tax=Ceratocystis fimbriata CBS 114723 TaxID=1035309 RepID=A0A2C5X373_9PEZI|nr:hypothetical protein CFIMG_002716RAa3 [Ceratocystis fimbriata CBS 114723]